MKPKAHAEVRGGDAEVRGGGKGEKELGVRAYPRIRKSVKWGGVVVSVLLVVVWVGSGWWGHAWYGYGGPYRGKYVSVAEGRVNIGSQGSIFAILNDSLIPPPAYVVITPQEPSGFKWWFHWHDDSWDTSFGTPMWVLALGAVLIGAYAWRLDALAWRRDRVGFCARCGYDRKGLAAGVVCPECGEGAASSPT